jgi:hypothetical protein
MYTAISSFFSSFKSTMEVIFLNAFEYRIDFIPSGSQSLLQNVPSVPFSIWETEQNHRVLVNLL